MEASSVTIAPKIAPKRRDSNMHLILGKEDMEQAYEAKRVRLSIYIYGPSVSEEVFYIAFPRFSDGTCNYSSIVDHQRQRLDDALRSAQEVCERFNLDNRTDVTGRVIKKAFDRN